MARHLGADERGEAVHVEQGYCHVTVPRVELLLHLDDRRQPAQEVASSPALELQTLDGPSPCQPSSHSLPRVRQLAFPALSRFQLLFISL